MPSHQGVGLCAGQTEALALHELLTNLYQQRKGAALPQLCCGDLHKQAHNSRVSTSECRQNTNRTAQAADKDVHTCSRCELLPNAAHCRTMQLGVRNQYTQHRCSTPLTHPAWPPKVQHQCTKLGAQLCSLGVATVMEFGMA